MAIAQVRRQLIEDTHKRVLRVTRISSPRRMGGGADILIASRSGLATGSIYRYFDSKVDLCVQVLAQVSEREARSSPKSSIPMEMPRRDWGTP